MPDRKAQFWALCATLTDFELCDRLAIAAEDLSDEVRSWPHVVVDQLWSFHGFTEGEGLAASAASCFFEGISLRPIAEAYDVIGLPAQAAVAWRLASISDEGNAADDAHTEDVSLFQDTDDFVAFLSDRIDLNECEEVIFDREAGFVKHLATFARNNLAAFEGLEIDLSPPERDPPNIGFLSSMLLWTRSYAEEHDGTVPTLQELKDHCMHDGIKRITSATHTILINGKLPEDLTKPLIRYHPGGANRAYVLTIGGRIAEEPTGDEQGGGDQSPTCRGVDA